MKIKIEKHLIRLILIFAGTHFLLSLYYAYLSLGNDFIMHKDFLKMLMGGIQVSDSGNLFYLILYLLPRCLFFLYVTNGFMKDLKTNFLYIFLRTKKRETWLRGVIEKTAISVLIYEFAYATIIVAVKICMWKNVCFSIQQFMEMIVMEALQLFMLALFSNMLLLFFSETTSVFGTLLEMSVPTLVTGIVYESNGRWQLPAKLILFNWGNYNYMDLCNMNMIITNLLIIVACTVIYMVSAWKIKNYELI